MRPELVAQVAFTEWTRDGGIRHPSFKGLREDKAAAEVVAEEAPPAGRVQRRGDRRRPSAARSSVREGRSRPAAPNARCRTADRKAEPPARNVNGVTLTHPDRVFWPATG